MAEERIRVGLIGANVNYGWGVRAHVPALRALPEYELVAVCTTRRETAEASAQAFGARVALWDYRELVRHPDVDVVAVSVRLPLHHDMVMAALGAGKHVFCEWPLGVNVAEAEAMAAAAEGRGVRHMVGLQARATPSLLRLKELVEEGYVGQVLAANVKMLLPGIMERDVSRAWMAERAKGAHSLSIAAGHALDIVCHCLGELAEASAEVRTQVRQWRMVGTGEVVAVDAPDNVMVQGVLAGGGAISAHIAYVPYHTSGWRLEVYGDQGTLVASSPQMVQFVESRLEGARRGDDGLRELPIPERLVWVPPTVPKGIPFNVAQMYRRLAQAIGDGKPAQPDFHEAVRRHRMLAALEQAAAEGRRLVMPPL
ncbi:MAG: Gfo/Idh/MocA family protein [Dehalococcoidia bacterium]